VGEPLPYDPEDRPDPSVRPQVERADWLVGAEAGMSEGPVEPLPDIERPRLLRPESTEMERPRPSGRTPFPGRPAPAAAPPAPAPPPPDMPKWDQGQNSVPMLRREGAPPAAGTPIPELGREFPMDDAEERARVAAEISERLAEEEAVAARPHAVVDPREFEVPDRGRGTAPASGSWLADRRVLAALVAVLAVVLTITFWPREEKTISVAHLKSHPERYADQAVRVGGRVAEVFPVGGSWAYSLVQGRDTIVVFTRAREPRLHEKVVVVGTLSTGYLDGASRAAIFESTR